jgi:hypothetical protein
VSVPSSQVGEYEVETNTVCSKTLAFKLQTPVNHPVESVRHSEHGGSLKSRIMILASLLTSNMLTQKGTFANFFVIVSEGHHFEEFNLVFLP